VIPVKLLVFDFDGTLADTKQDIADAFNYARISFGLDSLPVEAVTGAIGEGVRTLVAKLSGSGKEGQIDEILEKFREYYNDHLLDNTKPQRGALEILRHFKQKPKIILTNKSRGYTIKILEGLDLLKEFELVECGDKTKERKPNPAVILQVLKNFGIGPGEAMIIGDSAVDIKTGKNAGMKTCFVRDGYSSEESLEALKPDLIIQSINELKEHVV